MTSKRNGVMIMGCWKGRAGGCRDSKRCGCSQERGQLATLLRTMSWHRMGGQQ